MKDHFGSQNPTLRQIKAGEQPRDGRGRFVSNRDYSLDDESYEAVTPPELQVNAAGRLLEPGEDPFGIIDEMIDAQMAGYL